MKKFEQVLIVSDMDGTFLGKNGALVERNLDAIAYFCAHGGKFTFASGRSHDYITLSVPHPEQIVNLPAVTINGVCLYDFEKKEYVYSQRIPDGIAHEAVSFVFEHYPRTGIRGIAENEVLISNLQNPYMQREWDRVKTLPRRLLTTPQEWEGIPFFKVVFRDDPKILELLQKDMEGMLGDKLVLVPSEKTLLEMMPIGCNKGAMILRLKEEYAPNTKLLCTVGDFLNDLEMLSVADLPVCPANAHEAVKERCKLCLCDHKEGVIADLVAYLDEKM